MSNTEDEDFIVDEYSDSFTYKSHVYVHSTRWKKFMEQLHKLPFEKQEELREELLQEAGREYERLNAKKN